MASYISMAVELYLATSQTWRRSLPLRVDCKNVT